MPSPRTKGKKDTAPRGYMKIGDVARLVHVSPSVLRSWENLGLLNPPRTPSRYRLYSTEDLRLLKRARFLRRVRGLNPPAIVHLLRSQGQLRRSRPRAASASDKPLLGRRLRSLRLQRGLSLAAVAGATGVSVAFVSALERSETSASVATLRRLARFYNLNVLDFFDPPRSNPYLVKPRERKLLEAGPGVRMELLAWGNAIMEPHLFRIQPGAGSGESYSHEGEEFLHILQGELEISLDEGESFRLEAGDSFYFESTMSHRWSNPGKKETWVLWVNTPRTF